MRIGVLGTGMVGQALAAKLAEGGHEVVVGTRDPGATLAREEPTATATRRSGSGTSGTRTSSSTR
jgi:predicted dinucleotide-binding enzyme